MGFLGGPVGLLKCLEFDSQWGTKILQAGWHGQKQTNKIFHGFLLLFG